MTVGELVERGVAGARQRYFAEYPPERSSPPGGGFLVPRVEPNWLRITLESLGIWDAEVYEGRAAARHAGLPEQIPLRAHAGRWEQAITFHPKKPWRAMGVKQGDRVRVIVLKEE